ncbi:T9SS type A sorting domain-containing protein [Olleya sp. Ti.3.14]|uniref:T9SS type A sorting domain-containing protein n=1 Tax=Olleya sp. Ti.3.14 TaxID=3121297 RepID=UPI00311FF3FC
MKNKLLSLIFLLPSLIMSQVGNGFENTPGVTFNAVSNACQYFDTNTTTAHTLINYNANCGLVYVTEASSGSTLGYAIVLDPTTPNGPVGFSDGDYFGVATAASIQSELGFAPPEGTQAFFMDDVDGTVTMTFDQVDLVGSNPQFSMQYFLDDTNWDILDFFRVTIQFSDCASPALTLIDTTTETNGIDDLPGLQGSWQLLSADLSANATCKAQLVIEFSSNSGAEQLALDAIDFIPGLTLSTDVFDLSSVLSIYPNPSNGLMTIKNNGVNLKAVNVTDINGRLIKTINLNNSSINTILDLSTDLASGLYFITVVSEKGNLVKKIIIE